MLQRKNLLLVEPDSLFRRTVALTARQLNLAEVHEASSHEAAQRLLATQRFDALLLDIDEALTGLALLHSVRGGGTLCKSDLPMAVIATSMDASTIALLKPLGLRRIMLKPSKVKTVLEVVSSLAS